MSACTYVSLYKPVEPATAHHHSSASTLSVANTKLEVAAMLVILLLQASTLCAVAARRHAGGGGTPGVMTWNDFERGDDDGPSECDGRYHSNRDMIAALSTRLYDGGHRCMKMIRITSKHNGRAVEARVVDECGSKRGCKDDIVDTSRAVWEALRLDVGAGEVPVTWSDA